MEWLLNLWPVALAFFLGAGAVYLWKDTQSNNIMAQVYSKRENSAVNFLFNVYEPIAFRVVRDPDNRSRAYKEWQDALSFVFESYSEVLPTLWGNFNVIHKKHFEKYKLARIDVGSLTKREVRITFPWRVIEMNVKGESLHPEKLFWTEDEVASWVQSNWDGAPILDVSRIPRVCGLDIYDPSGDLYQSVRLDIPA